MGFRRVKNGGEKNGRERRIRRGRRMRGERRMRRKSVRVRALLRGQISTALTGQRAGPSFRQPVMLGRIWPGIDKTDIRPPQLAERVKTTNEGLYITRNPLNIRIVQCALLRHLFTQPILPRGAHLRCGRAAPITRSRLHA